MITIETKFRRVRSPLRAGTAVNAETAAAGNELPTLRGLDAIYVGHPFEMVRNGYAPARGMNEFF